MQKLRWSLGALLLILAPATSRAQFDALKFVDLPSIGSWAEYQITLRNQSFRRIHSQKVSLIARQAFEGADYLWFQVETASDEFGAQRVALVYQVAIRAEEAAGGEDLFGKIREMIVRLGDRPAFRVAPDFLQVGMQRGLIVGGQGGAGSDVEYAYRDLEPESVEVVAGKLSCSHKKGIGEGEVVLDLNDPKRHPVDSIVDLWLSEAIPFGLVRRITRTTGKKQVDEGSLLLTLDSEEIVELVAYGTGAGSLIEGQIFDYDPSIAAQLRPTEQ